MLDIIYDNIRLYGGSIFIGTCVLVGFYWLRLTLLEMNVARDTDQGSNTTIPKRRLE